MLTKIWGSEDAYDSNTHLELDHGGDIGHFSMYLGLLGLTPQGVGTTCAYGTSFTYKHVPCWITSSYFWRADMYLL